jgi:hypothetical protein
MDTIPGKVLADGTIKTVTDPISPENHQNAEAFMKYLAQLTGGEVHIEARGTHAHVHTHTDTGVTHSH